MYFLGVAIHFSYFKVRALTSQFVMGIDFILINPLIIALIFSFGRKSRLIYETHFIQDTLAYREQFDELKVIKKMKLLGSIGEIELFKMRSKETFLPIKFSMKESKNVIELTIPKTLIKDFENLL